MNHSYPLLVGVSNMKTVVDITVTASFWIQQMEYDQYRLVWPFDIMLVTTHALVLHSFWLHTSPVTNNGLSVN
jgi:hypothetical protein